MKNDKINFHDAICYLLTLNEEANFNTMTGKLTRSEIDQMLKTIHSALKHGWRCEEALQDIRSEVNRAIALGESKFD